MGSSIFPSCLPLNVQLDRGKWHTQFNWMGFRKERTSYGELVGNTVSRNVTVSGEPHQCNTDKAPRKNVEKAATFPNDYSRNPIEILSQSDYQKRLSRQWKKHYAVVVRKALQLLLEIENLMFFTSLKTQEITTSARRKFHTRKVGLKNEFCL